MLVALALAALSAPLTTQPDAPPVLIGAGHIPGTVRVAFPGGFEADALPRVVVALRGDAVPAILQAKGRALGAHRRSWVLDAADPVAAAIALSRDPAVLSALPDLVLRHRSAAFDDPRYEGQWYLEDLEMEPLFAVTLGDPDVRVAVIDSGIDLDHPDLAAGFVDPYDAWSDDDDPRPDPGEFCQGSSTAICDEHGTAVSGIIGARSNNGEGIVGMCSECTLIPIKMLGDGNGSLSADVDAFEHAIDADAAVINNSWGFVDPTPVPGPLAAVIHRAATEPRGGKGAVVIFAAGNDDRELGDDEVEALDDVLCVSATDSYGRPTAYTNSGNAVDVAAPSATFTTAPGGEYTETFGGTSAAAPVVSGLAGWLLSADPELTAADARALFVDTAFKTPTVTFDDEGHHAVYGYGQIDPGAILDVLYPSDTDGDGTAKACGCSAAPGAGSWLLLGLAAIAAYGRPISRSAASAARTRSRTS